MGHPKISGGSVAEVATWASRLTVEQYEKEGRRDWLRRITDPDFNIKRLIGVVLGLPWPKPGEVFELTLNASDRKNQPLAMARADGYTSRKLQYSGQKLSGKLIGRFKLVEIGNQSNWESIQGKLARHGKIPGGQWRQALKTRFVDVPGRSVGVADTSWSHGTPLGHRALLFPCVHHDGTSRFCQAIDGSFGEQWLWLVEVA